MNTKTILTVGQKKTLSRLREVISLAKPTKGFEISLKATGDPALKHLQVVTESWKSKPRWDRIGKVTDALVKHMPIGEREHIVSVSVFTKEEFADRTAFAKKMARISRGAIARPTVKAPTKNAARVPGRKKMVLA